MYDFVPPNINYIEHSCNTPRSKTPISLATFPDNELISPSTKQRTLSTDINPFEVRSESEDQEQTPTPKNTRLPFSSKQIEEPKTIEEPIINHTNRSFLPPQILARSPKSNILNQSDENCDDDEIYMTESLIAQYVNDDSKNYFKCFVDDDHFQPEPKQEEQITAPKPEKPQITCFQDFKKNIPAKNEFNRNNSFEEFDTKFSKVNNSMANEKLNNVAFDDNSNDFNDEPQTIGLSNKFGQARLLNFNEQGFLPISIEEQHSPRSWHESPPPFLPEVVTPYNFRLEFLKNEAEENLNKAKIEWENKISTQKQISQQRFNELIERQRIELLPYEQSNQYKTSPQRLELINRKDEREQEIPILRVRTVPSDSITKAIKDYESMNHDMPSKKTFFKATPDSQSRYTYRKGPLLLTTVQNRNAYVGDNSETKQKIRNLKAKHKQEIITLDQECSATLKALEDKRNADINMKETHLQNILKEIEKQNESKSNQIDFNKRTILNHRFDNQDFDFYK